MTKAIRLTDIQLVLLASAAARDNGNLLPPPETLGDSLTRIRKAVTQLINRGLAMEIEMIGYAETWRVEGEQPIGVVITDAGRAAINVEPDSATSNDADEHFEPSQAPAAPRTTKSADVIALMQRPDGATLDELVAATGWLPHTTRAALTGLRKKGHAIERSKRGDVTCYTLPSEAAA